MSKGKKRVKNSLKLRQAEYNIPVKGKDLMNFVNGTQDQKNLEVMLMLLLFQDL